MTAKTIATALALTIAAGSAGWTHSQPGWRQQAREVATDAAKLDALAGADPSPSPEDIAIQRQEVKHLQVALAALPEREREVITLHYLDGLGVQEVADRLGVSRWTVQRLERAALATLREALQENRHA